MSGAQVAHLFLRAAIGGALMTSVKQIEHLNKVACRMKALFAVIAFHKFVGLFVVFLHSRHIGTPGFISISPARYFIIYYILGNMFF